MMRQEIEKGERIMSKAAVYQQQVKIENGIVAVTAYGVIAEITFPLIFEFINHHDSKGDVYRNKPEIAQMIQISKH